jgi:hypothetical protein
MDWENKCFSNTSDYTSYAAGPYMLNATAQGNIMHTGNATKLAKYNGKNKTVCK